MGARARVTLLGALLALSFAACGGDDADGGSESVSGEEYERRADAALAAFADLETLSAPLANPESVEQYVSGVREIVAEVNGTVEGLEAIDPPEDVVGLHAELINAVEEFRDVFPPIADAAEAGDDAALQAGAQDLQAAAVEFEETATDLDQRFEEAGIELGLAD